MASTRHLATTPRQVLTRALALIERPLGWCKGASHRDRSSGITAVCASAALQDVPVRRPGIHMQARRILLDTIRDTTGHNDSIVSYNDEVGRRKYQIVNLYKRAIAKA